MFNKDYELTVEKLVNWLRQKVEEADCKGAVVGLSGGIDSSVTAILAKKAFSENMLGVIMPCVSNPQDQKDAQLVAKQFGIETEVIDLIETYKNLVTRLDTQQKSKLALANIKPRLRMTTLYYYANLRNSLVVGTDNRSELKLGYFTKYGDGGIDLAPLGNLVKTEVKEVAKILGIPEKVISKPPSAGLWANQTDEEELGVSYKEIDRYILTGKLTRRFNK
ncbi:NAD+ synthase [Natroniella sulfidigena]|uniref:NAD+ synthase n=1 Tax=Natroniella sulfidigena TaxID=723921 RepID=UPI0031F507D1